MKNVVMLFPDPNESTFVRYPLILPDQATTLSSLCILLTYSLVDISSLLQHFRNFKAETNVGTGYFYEASPDVVVNQLFGHLVESDKVAITTRIHI